MSWIDKVEHCLENTNNKIIKIPWLKNKISIKNNFEKIQLLEYLRKRIKKDLNFDFDQFVNYIFSECKVKNIKIQIQKLIRKFHGNK